MDYPKRDDLFEGKFTDGNPVAGIAASRDNAAQMNAVYDEIRAAIQAGGLTPDADDLTQLSASIRKQVRSKQGFSVSGDANAIVLTSVAGKPKVTELEDFDEIQFMVSATNTNASVTVKVDGLAPIALSSVVAANQLFEGFLTTLIYFKGVFCVVSQTNPITGNDDYVPPGSIISFAASTPPPKGWLECDGAALSRKAYVNLFNTIGTVFGNGDGSTTFNLPDLRGEFIRGFDHGRGVDNQRNFGGFQNPTYIRSLIDKLSNYPDGTFAVGAWEIDDWISGSATGARTDTPLDNTTYYIGTARASDGSGDNAAFAVRPRNLSLLYCIKY